MVVFLDGNFTYPMHADKSLGNHSDADERNYKLQLREYQKRISNILESFTDGFFEVDQDWIVTYFNKEAERLLSLSRTEIIGQNLWQVFREAIPLRFYSEYHRAVKENVSVRFEEYFPPKDLWVEVAAFPSGQGLSVYFKDITERKKALELLNQEKQKYSELFNFSPVPQWVYDLDTGRFLDVNEAAVSQYGYQREEFLNMNIRDIRLPEDIPSLERILTEDVKAGAHSKSYVRHKKKDGELIYALVEGNSISFEGYNARLVMAIDRTKEVMAENSMAESIARFDIVSKATSDAIWDWDIVSGTIVWNQGIRGIFGYRQTTYSEAWWMSKVHPDDLELVTSQMNRLIEKKKQRLKVSYRFQCADGEYKNVLDRAFIIFNKEEEAVRMIGSMQDITDQIKQMKEIEAQNNRLRQISWIQSHKVRGPLARIIGLASLMSEETLSSNEKTEFAGDLKHAAYELDKVVEEIVDRTEYDHNLKITVIALNLRNLRILKGWTQKQVAEWLQIPLQKYLKWEHADTDIDYLMLLQIAHLYEIPVIELM